MGGGPTRIIAQVTAVEVNLRKVTCVLCRNASVDGTQREVHCN